VATWVRDTDRPNKAFYRFAQERVEHDWQPSAC
jgi:hypothetical protein